MIRANRKFEWFGRIGLTRYKNRGFNCEWFARIDSRESRCESPVPLSSEECRNPNHHNFSINVLQYTSKLYCNTPSNVYCSAFGVLEPQGKIITLTTSPICIAIRPHLYRKTLAKLLVFGVVGDQTTLKLPLPFRGFQRGVFADGGISIIGVVRAPVAIVNLAFFAPGLLVESYINSEIFAGIWGEINCCNRCAHEPNYWDFSPSQKPPFGNPQTIPKRKIRRLSYVFVKNLGTINLN